MARSETEMNPIKCAACAVLSMAGVASAQNQITFTYSDVSVSFDNTTRQFNGVAVAPPLGFQTGGDVTRATTGQTADFATGFAGISTANMTLNMTIGTTFAPDFMGRNTVVGTGGFTLTDIDGDTITGSILGIWTDLGNGTEGFQGSVNSASINPLAGGDNLNFNGTAGFFPYAGLPMSNLFGSFVELQLTTGIFFNANFNGISSQVDGILVPGPGSLALLGLGGLVAARRRR